MDPFRRRFLMASLAAPLLARGAGGDTGAPSMRPLRLPGTSGFMALHRLSGPIALTAGIRREPLFPGRTTDVMAYRTSIGGGETINPVVIARKDDIVDVTLANRLGEDTTIHWHGLAVDEKNDGSGMVPVRNGESYVYRFAVRNRAATYWYHPHPHDRTGAQVHLGMAGMLIVEDAEEDALRRELGLELGRNEIPLLLQDKQVDARNRIRYEMGEDDWIGNRVLVNFVPEPALAAEASLHRFRIMNGSNARTYLLAFVQEGRTVPLTLIGTDGGLLDRSRALTQAYLAPAQRIDVLVDLGALPAGSTVTLASLAYEPMDFADAESIPGMEHAGAPPMGAPFDIMRIELRPSASGRRTIPASLSSMPAAKRSLGTPRKFLLHARKDKWFINDYNFHQDMNAVKLRVARGSVETWEIRNDAKSMPHPMHLHGFQFRVLSRKGSPAQVKRHAITPLGLTAQDLGWLDTVLVWPGETVAIAIDFSQPFTGEQRYMFHCHNLEHEDQGMMLAFAVEDRAR